MYQNRYVNEEICIFLNFLEFIYFVLTYVLCVYVSSLLLSSENICGTRPWKWGTK